MARIDEFRSDTPEATDLSDRVVLQNMLQSTDGYIDGTRVFDETLKMIVGETRNEMKVAIANLLQKDDLALFSHIRRYSRGIFDRIFDQTPQLSVIEAGKEDVHMYRNLGPKMVAEIVRSQLQAILSLIDDNGPMDPGVSVLVPPVVVDVLEPVLDLDLVA